MFRRNQRKQITKPEECFFCQNKIQEIDYADANGIKKFISPYAKILPRRITGICAKHQRKLSRAIKNARFMALLPFTRK